MKYKIGETVVDEDGNIGRIAIVWNDGDICTIENDAAHPNPVTKSAKSIIVNCPPLCDKCMRLHHAHEPCRNNKNST